jgi:hypothetical protein
MDRAGFLPVFAKREILGVKSWADFREDGMARRFPWSVIAAGAAAATVAHSAHAAGPYDGTWVIDIPASLARGVQSTGPCPALRLEAKIVDSQVTASLERVPSGTTETVENSTARTAAPLTGTVEADGTVTADWQGYKSNGKLSGDTGAITVQGECGPRDATATRVAK